MAQVDAAQVELLSLALGLLAVRWRLRRGLTTAAIHPPHRDVAPRGSARSRPTDSRKSQIGASNLIEHVPAFVTALDEFDIEQLSDLGAGAAWPS